MNLKAAPQRAKRLFVVALCISVVGCASIAPAIKTLAIAFGQDLLAAAAVNYTPNYAIQVENLLAVLAKQATGMNFQPQLASQGYQTPPPKYLEASRNPAAQETGYDDGYSDSSSDGYDDDVNSGYDDSADSGYADSSDDGYADQGDLDQGGYADQVEVSQDYEDQGYEDQGYEDQSYEDQGYEDQEYGDYADAAGSVENQTTDNPRGVLTSVPPLAYAAGGGSTSSEQISLEVGLLVQRAGSTELQIFEDGAVLKDGRGDPVQGDLIKVHFRSSCACYLYIVGIDATGFAAQIFPDPQAGLTNPVQAHNDYSLPKNSDQWWALDDQRGVENVYFVASRGPRRDLEEAITQLAQQTRQSSNVSTRAVAEPAILPRVRGMVKVTAAPRQVAFDQRQASVRPDAFISTLSDVDVVVSRWFRHE